MIVFSSVNQGNKRENVFQQIMLEISCLLPLLDFKVHSVRLLKRFEDNLQNFPVVRFFHNIQKLTLKDMKVLSKNMFSWLWMYVDGICTDVVWLKISVVRKVESVYLHEESSMKKSSKQSSRILMTSLKKIPNHSNTFDSSSSATRSR